MTILMDFEAFTVIPMWGSIHPAWDWGGEEGELGVELKEEKVKYREIERGKNGGNKKGKRKGKRKRKKG